MIALILMVAAIAGETELEARARLAGEYEAEVGVVLEDGTECDLVSDRYALDVAFAADWRTAVGQALLCASWANRQPGVILLRDRAVDATAVWRCGLACQRAGIDLFLEDVMATVVGRHVFYPGSYYGDEIDPTKSALLPGGTGAFANYISRAVFVGGGVWPAAFRGIYVDVDGLAAPGSITAADFAFRYGNDNDPTGWAVATAPSVVSVAAGAGVGGSDRIKITWADSAMANSRWLQVTVLANVNTGLAIHDVHYWGIAVGETGDSATDAEVTVVDEQRVADNISPDPVLITSRWDIDKSGFVTLFDRVCVLSNYTNEETGTALLLITVPPGPVAGPYGVDAGEVFHTGATAGQGVVTGQRAGEVFHVGAVAGRNFVTGGRAGEVFHTGAAAGQIKR